MKIFQLGKPKFGSKNYQFWNRPSFPYSSLLAIFPTFILALWYKFVNFQIRNVRHSKILLSEILNLIPFKKSIIYNLKNYQNFGYSNSSKKNVKILDISHRSQICPTLTFLLPKFLSTFLSHQFLSTTLPRP